MSDAAEQDLAALADRLDAVVSASDSPKPDEGRTDGNGIVRGRLEAVWRVAVARLETGRRRTMASLYVWKGNEAVVCHFHKTSSDWTYEPLSPAETRAFTELLQKMAFISSVMTKELEWAREAAMVTLTQNPVLVPWAFEFTPPSSETASRTYLRKVREADVVVWLVGEETSDSVRDEIAEALSAKRRLWVIKLPAPNRDRMTVDLLAEVGKRAKYGDASNESELRTLLVLTFSDEVVRALRDRPGLTRLAQLESLARASRARMVSRWRATGLSSSEAVDFADDPSVGVLPPSTLPDRVRSCGATPIPIAIAARVNGKTPSP